MAEEATGAVEAAETTVAPPEETEGAEQQTEEQQEPEAITALASEMGWTPKDQWRGPPEAWKPASEFIKAGRDIQQTLRSEVRGLRDEVSRMSRTSAELAEGIRNRTIAERDSYWARVQAKGVEDGDQEAVNKAVEERVKLKTEAAQTNSADPGPPPETAAFVEKHKAWFNVDPLATMRAQEICDQLAKRGISIPDQLRQAERAIRKEFPEHFPAATKAPASTQTGQSRSAAPSSGRVKGYADMPHESQKMAQDYLERHGVPLEEFAKSYWKDHERKVG